MSEDKNTGKKYKGGRKPAIDPAVHRYGIKLNSVENAKFEALFVHSGLFEKSKFIKAMIFNKKIKVLKVDKAAMDYYMRLTNIYVQYKAVGVNYNQTVKALKTNFSEKRALALLYKLEKITIELILLSKQIIALTKEFEERWLQK